MMLRPICLRRDPWLSGGADFCGANPQELRQEFRKLLDVFLEVCQQKGIEIGRRFSGKFNLRIPPEFPAA
jgi:predicted HicB family RNase H-like nuclease